LPTFSHKGQNMRHRVKAHTTI